MREKADKIYGKWDRFMLGNVRGNPKVTNRVHRVKTVGSIHNNMHANAVNEQFADMSWECGALMSPTA